MTWTKYTVIPLTALTIAVGSLGCSKPERPQQQRTEIINEEPKNCNSFENLVNKEQINRMNKINIRLHEGFITRENCDDSRKLSELGEEFSSLSKQKINEFKEYAKDQKSLDASVGDYSSLADWKEGISVKEGLTIKEKQRQLRQSWNEPKEISDRGVAIDLASKYQKNGKLEWVDLIGTSVNNIGYFLGSHSNLGEEKLLKRADDLLINLQSKGFKKALQYKLGVTNVDFNSREFVEEIAKYIFSIELENLENSSIQRPSRTILLSQYATIDILANLGSDKVSEYATLLSERVNRYDRIRGISNDLADKTGILQAIVDDRVNYGTPTTITNPSETVTSSTRVTK